jgi:hypothetical protein
MPRTLTSPLSILAMLVWLGLASNASALTLTGGPVYRYRVEEPVRSPTSPAKPAVPCRARA